MPDNEDNGDAVDIMVSAMSLLPALSSNLSVILRETYFSSNYIVAILFCNTHLNMLRIMVRKLIVLLPFLFPGRRRTRASFGCA